MTPKSKAQKLYKQYHATCNATIAGASTLFKEIAKNAAMLAVDEILNLDVWYNPHNTYYGRDFWESVKKELQNL
jgi:hypothetical protein